MEGAAGGIILTASHNPREWNALKLLNEKGEFLSAEDGEWILARAAAVEEADGNIDYVDVMKLGTVRATAEYGQRHIDAILSHPLVDVEAVRARGFKVVVDPVNSSGALFVPQLLAALGVTDVTLINGEPNGHFSHNPEPLPENLRELCSAVTRAGADLGIAVDPDVDRLCFVNEDGSLFGEEYTLVAVADYILSKNGGGDTVSNLSSTRALRDVTEKWGGTYYGAAVGEVNVVDKMKAVNAIIGGEGNGGVIVPELHYGRDALAGIALFLTHLAQFGKSISSLRRTYPDYYISKNKIELSNEIDISALFLKLAAKYRKQPINTDDGLKIEFDKDWVHLRPSNTEPIIRIYAESTSETTADNIARKLMSDMREEMMAS
jgi:phosphomannomutase